MKAVVVYYSLQNNCDYVAKKIAAQTGADLLRLKPVKPYPNSGPAKFLAGGRAALAKAEPELQPLAFDPDEYDTVILGTPVWAGTVAPPLRTFLRIYDVSDKHIGVYTCSSGGSEGKCFDELKALSRAGSVAATLALKDPGSKHNPENGRRIAEFCAKLRG